jgi:hypothetical protein
MGSAWFGLIRQVNGVNCQSREESKAAMYIHIPRQTHTNPPVPSISQHNKTSPHPPTHPPTHRPAPRPIDFGAHVLATTQDYGISHLPLLAKILVAPFFHHRLHHLLPGVDESRLPELEGVLQQTCAEFGESYRVYTYKELAWGCWRNWMGLVPTEGWRWGEGPATNVPLSFLSTPPRSSGKGKKKKKQ